MTMYEYIWSNSKDHLSEVALRYYGTKITYDEVFHRIKKTAAALSAMRIHSGDVVTIMALHTPEDGFVFIKGRIKRIYITRGKDNMAYKLFPQRIEEVINSIEEVEQCAVIVKEHEEKMNVAIAVVSLKNSEKSEKEILERIKEHAQLELPDHMIPVKYQIIDKVPITQSGKIDYRKLEELLDNKGELKSNV